MDLAGPIGGDDHYGRLVGADGTQLGDGDLEIRQQLQKESFEFLVGPVYLVDKQHRRTLSRIVKGLEQGALNKELFAEQLF